MRLSHGIIDKFKKEMNKADRHKSRAHTKEETHIQTLNCKFAFLHICILAHLHTCSFAHLLIYILAHLHTCTFANLHICIPAHLHNSTFA